MEKFLARVYLVNEPVRATLWHHKPLGQSALRFGRTSLGVVKRIIDIVGVFPHTTVLDIGSGDG